MWTKEQLQAINESGQNIIVSAGAGSGKTAVLTNRILEKVKRRVDLSSLLVLTFTNAAAKEMKERLRTMFIKEGLTDLLDKLDQAYITTFDAYSLALVKKYYYKLNINPSVSIADSLIIKQKKKEIVREILTNLYNSEDISLHNYLWSFTVKNDTQLSDLVVDLTYKVDLKADTASYLQNYIKNYFSEASLDALVTAYESIVKNKLSELVDSAKELYEGLEEGKVHETLDLFIDDVKDLSSYLDCKRYFDDFSLPSLARGTSDEIKTLKDNFVKQVKVFKETYLIYEDTSHMVEGMLLSQKTIEFLLSLVNKAMQVTIAYKEKNDYYEFIDIAKLAIKLVTDFQEIRDEIKYSLSEILIDEYQDTSDLQEVFINQIENNNLYMVGDIKQSIYRFRNANPYIFKDKYERYSRLDGGIKIDLNSNFRSRKEVLEDINEIFSGLMTNEYGDAAYLESHRMNFGNKKYNEHKENRDYHLQLLTYQTNTTYDNFNAAEIEAHIIASDILKKVRNQKVYDHKQGYLRESQFSDFCILIDKSTHFFTIKKVLEGFGIPLSINADLNLNESTLSKLICHLINLVYHVKSRNLDSDYYYSFCSIARSFIFEYSDELIYDLIMSRDTNNKLYELASSIARLVDERSCSDIYLKILEYFEIYQKLPLIANVNNSLVQLEFLANMIENLESLGYTFDKLALYLQAILAGDEAIKYSLGSAKGNSVQIMTIHKSKGLEFPICYFPLLHVKFNTRDLTSDFGFNHKYGFICPINQNGLEKTIIQRVAIEEAIKEEVSEHIRLFYVGLTRAREQIILINQELEYNAKYLLPQNFLSFGHFLFSIMNILEKNKIKIKLADLNLNKDYLIKTKIGNSLTANQRPVYDSLNIPNNKVDKRLISKQVDKILSNQELANIKLGLEIHSVLEVLDFKNYKLDGLLISDDIKDKLRQILTLDVFKNISQAKVYQEYEFETTIELEQYHGIIDLLIVYDDHIDIIDYKLADISQDAYLKQLNIYQKFIRQKSNLTINVYLLSILKVELKKINLE